MKTLSLRLTDLEAEALDMLACANGLSKNKQIVRLITDAYCEIDGYAQVLFADLFSIGCDSYKGLLDTVMENMRDMYDDACDSEGKTTTRDLEKKGKQAANLISRVMEETTDEKTLEELENYRLEIMEMLGMA